MYVYPRWASGKSRMMLKAVLQHLQVKQSDEVPLQNMRKPNVFPTGMRS